MIKIYFDNELIDEDKYSSLSNNFELFDTTFKLGTTSSNIFKLSVGKEAVTIQPSEVKIYDDTTLMATLVIDNIEEDDYSYTYTLTDKMVNLEFYYDASLIFVNGHTTLLDIALDICSKAGITLATTDFRGYDKDISWNDNTRTAREYIGYIAELNGGYAQIGEDGRLYFLKQKTNAVKTIGIDDCKDFKIGERKEITRVVYELGTLKYEYGDETGNTLYLNSDNVFITEASEVEAIYNEIQGFVFYNFTTTDCPIDFNIKAGQVITISDGENEYPTIAGYELAFYGEWYGGYSLDVESTKQEETQVISTDKKIKNLKIIVDREANRLTQLVQETSEQNERMDKEGYGTLSFEGIKKGEPIYIKIYPRYEDICYLYPSNKLYPSPTLYPYGRKVKFENTTTGRIIYYELPCDLFYYDEIHYDEFILDYECKTCIVNKRVGFNTTTGEKYLLEDTQIITYEYPAIRLENGDYTITVLTSEDAYIQVKLVLQFITKTEMNTAIEQTAESIELNVDKKLEEYSTTTEMNSAINVKAGEITSSVSETLKKYTDDEIVEAKSEIKQTTDSISLKVEEKLDEDDFTGANIMLAINNDSSSASINADKISLSGKTINLTSDNMAISSNHFNVDNNGNTTITSTASAYTGAELKLIGQLITNYLYSSAVVIRPNNVSNNLGIAGMEVIPGTNGYEGILALTSQDGEYINLVPTQGIDVSSNIHATGTVTGSNIQSDERLKKNIKDTSSNALDIINKINHKEFDWIKDNKHTNIGYIAQELEKIDENFVIKENETYYVNLLPILATTTKAIQEQQKQIEQLQKEIEVLRGEK